jgi:hypothetical protein
LLNWGSSSNEEKLVWIEVDHNSRYGRYVVIQGLRDVSSFFKDLKKKKMKKRSYSNVGLAEKWLMW